MNIVHTTTNDVLIITLEEESLYTKDIGNFKEQILELISRSEVNSVILDFHNLHFIDSSGLGCLLSILRMLNSKGGKLKLTSINKQIRTMFELVSMHKIFEVYFTNDDAMRSFQSNIST